jgi:hypothetical protein
VPEQLVHCVAVPGTDGGLKKARGSDMPQLLQDEMFDPPFSTW